ncbi:PAS domain S-box protein [Actomonas aquatica]|uniref:histidine kinase n=1 Tax=Actomonas aquatica TaxID=2866162 RepID=A0ABZ1C702_9BACT|nr:PAS domain S-box protein [Opitutus sp. WL0086]WRQ87508.1 PAS domain S-box protein [Opitutus sp. WL0086]
MSWPSALLLNGAGWGLLGGVLVVAAFVLGFWWRGRRGTSDPSKASQADQAGRERGQADLQSVLSNLDVLVWEAEVLVEGESLRWDFRIKETRMTQRLFAEGWQERRISLWRHLQVPEMAEMDRRSRGAILEGLPGYQQEFRVPEGDGFRWVRETVAIEQRAADRYWLVGFAVDITDQRLAEEEFRHSERSLTEILKGADCLLWRSQVERGADGVLQWLHFRIPRSGLYPRLFGDRPATMGGKLWSLVEVPDLEAMNRRSRDALENGAPEYEQTFSVRNRAGESFWLQEKVSIYPIGANQWHLVGIVTDVTQRRKAELAVRRSEGRYRSLFEHVPVSIVEADFTAVGEWLERLRGEGVTDLRAYLQRHPREISRGAMRVQILAANVAARRTIGAESTRQIRWRRRVLETPSSMEAVLEAFVALWEGRNFIERVVELRSLHGRHITTTMRWWVAHGEQGYDLSQVIMIYVDVTELKRVQGDLAAQREQLSVTLRSMKEGVVTTDTIGRVQFINPAAQELIGVSEANAIGQPLLRACGFKSAESGEPLSLELERVAAGDAVLNLPANTVIEKSPGDLRLIEGELAPVHDRESRVTGVVLVFRDITDRDRLEKEMVRATRLEGVGVLAGGIAHDFNNILTAVIGNLSIAAIDTEEHTDVGSAVRDARRAALKAKDLTQQLLTFAKGGEPIRAAVQLPEVIRDMAGFALHGANVRAEFDFAEDLWLANVDKGQIGRVVQNLVINAVQAMPGGGRVTLQARNEVLAYCPGRRLQPGKYVRIDISDTGGGIRPEHLARVFDPYFSTKESGSGLGLSAAYSIVAKHQGVIEVASTLGEGTTFTIWLPVAVTNETAPEEVAVELEAPLRGRVLFMDDEEPIREMIVTLLRRLGMEVQTTADGEELVEVYRREFERGTPPDLVLTDLTVPGGMGGQQAMEILLTINPAVRAVVSSGYSSDPILANFRDYGFCGMVAKPYELPELRRVLQEALSTEPDSS